MINIKLSFPFSPYFYLHSISNTNKTKKTFLLLLHFLNKLKHIFYVYFLLINNPFENRERKSSFTKQWQECRFWHSFGENQKLKFIRWTFHPIWNILFSLHLQEQCTFSLLIYLKKSIFFLSLEHSFSFFLFFLLFHLIIFLLNIYKL